MNCTVTMETVTSTAADARPPFRRMVACMAVAAFVFVAAPAPAATYNVMLQTNLFGNLDQHNLTPYPTMSCGPASAANAMAYASILLSILFTVYFFRTLAVARTQIGAEW